MRDEGVMVTGMMTAALEVLHFVLCCAEDTLSNTAATMMEAATDCRCLSCFG